MREEDLCLKKRGPTKHEETSQEELKKAPDDRETSGDLQSVGLKTGGVRRVR